MHSDEKIPMVAMGLTESEKAVVDGYEGSLRADPGVPSGGFFPN